MAKPKMMIVEDEIITALGLSKEFEGLGYTMCALVSSGEDALHHIESERPDVILMDISLRGSPGGIEAARQIHSRFGIPIVFITGYLDPEIMEQAKATEPLGYFVKPLDCKKIGQVIDSTLHKHQEVSR